MPFWVGSFAVSGLRVGAASGAAGYYGSVKVFEPAVIPTDPTGPTDPGPGGPGPVIPGTRIPGPGGVPRPAPGPNVTLATGDTTSTLSISQSGTPGNPLIFDGGGFRVGRLTVTGDNIIVQNYRVVANGNYGIVLNNANNCTLQNCDISNIRGPGDINGITLWGGTDVNILYNTMINAISNPGGSHTDFIQHWISSSHPEPTVRLQVIGNKAIGPHNPSRSNPIPSIHQWLMAEGYNRNGNSGGRGLDSRDWYIADNELGDSWNQAMKFDGIHNVTVTRNRFVGSSSRAMLLTGGSANTKYYSDNQLGSRYGSVGMTVTSGAGPARAPWLAA